LQRAEPDPKNSEDTSFVSVESDGDASLPASPSPALPAGVRSVLSKGSKKWLGEALEVAEEAAAALRLSPRSKRDMYGFEDSDKTPTPYHDAECTQRSEPPAFQVNFAPHHWGNRSRIMTDCLHSEEYSAL